MNDEFVLGIASQLALMALTGVAGWLGGKIRGAKVEKAELQNRDERERDSTRSALRLLLFYRLKDIFERYVVRGEGITASDKHEIEELYDLYHSEYGGNGDGTRMYRELIELKTEA